MSNVIFHYTTVRHLRRILATGVLKPHPTTIVPVALVWASSAHVWEPSCAPGLWPSENEAATSGNVALPSYKTMASSTRLACATEEKALCHNSCDGHSVGTLLLAWLVAQRLTPCNYNMKGYAALSP